MPSVRCLAASGAKATPKCLCLYAPAIYDNSKSGNELDRLKKAQPVAGPSVTGAQPPGIRGKTPHPVALYKSINRDSDTVSRLLGGSRCSQLRRIATNRLATLNSTVFRSDLSRRAAIFSQDLAALLDTLAILDTLAAVRVAGSGIGDACFIQQSLAA
jgi:hypothetical protein